MSRQIIPPIKFKCKILDLMLSIQSKARKHCESAAKGILAIWVLEKLVILEGETEGSGPDQTIEYLDLYFALSKSVFC